MTTLSTFIQELNTNVFLYKRLAQVTANSSLMQSFTEEQQRMAILLQKDYERDGIHLERSKRDRVITIRDEIMLLGMDFQRNIQSARAYVEIPERLMRPLPYHIKSHCDKSVYRPDILHVPTDGHVADAVLKWIKDPQVRKTMYMASTSCALANDEVLVAVC